VLGEADGLSDIERSIWAEVGRAEATTMTSEFSQLRRDVAARLGMSACCREHCRPGRWRTAGVERSDLAGYGLPPLFQEECITNA
jgi:hypothetical protein